MRAVVVPRHGGPEVLTVEDRPSPSPGPRELLVDSTAAGVNFIDTYQRSGVYPTETPFVPGLEGAGTVAAVGADVSGVAVGDRVAWMAAPGSYAEQVLVPAGAAVPVPDGVPDDVAAGALLQGITAHYLAHSTYPVREGDTVLLHAGAGGVGLLLTQLAKQRGGRVITTVSTDEKEALSRRAGADEVLRYEGFADRARELTGGRGVDVVYDGVGKATFDDSLASLRPRGMMVLFGGASGQVPPIDPQRLNAGGSLYLTRPTTAHYIATRDELTWRAGDILGGIASGTLDLRIGGRYALGDAGKAHADLESRRTTGKLLILTR
ncbi:MAG TPA: quinone oxidoreductase [Mycobacteriales bacterium]|jgi:NADPH2:quinone reductase